MRPKRALPTVSNEASSFRIDDGDKGGCDGCDKGSLVRRRSLSSLSFSFSSSPRDKRYLAAALASVRARPVSPSGGGGLCGVPAPKRTIGGEEEEEEEGKLEQLSRCSAAAKSRRVSTQGGRLPSEVSIPPPRIMMASYGKVSGSEAAGSRKERREGDREEEEEEDEEEETGAEKSFVAEDRWGRGAARATKRPLAV